MPCKQRNHPRNRRNAPAEQTRRARSVNIMHIMHPWAGGRRTRRGRGARRAPRARTGARREEGAEHAEARGGRECSEGAEGWGIQSHQPVPPLTPFPSTGYTSCSEPVVLSTCTPLPCPSTECHAPRRAPPSLSSLSQSHIVLLACIWSMRPHAPLPQQNEIHSVRPSSVDRLVCVASFVRMRDRAPSALTR